MKRGLCDAESADEEHGVDREVDVVDRLKGQVGEGFAQHVAVVVNGQGVGGQQRAPRVKAHDEQERQGEHAVDTGWVINVVVVSGEDLLRIADQRKRFQNCHVKHLSFCVDKNVQKSAEENRHKYQG